MKKTLSAFTLAFMVLSFLIGCTARQEVKTVTQKRTVFFKTVKQDDPMLPKGESRVKQEGEKGEKITTYKATYENSQLKSKKKISDRITRKPTDEVVLVGTQTIEKVTEMIPYEVQCVDDPSIEVGEEKVRAQGAGGEREKVFKVAYKDGREVLRELISDTITKNPIPRLIAKGTKKPEPRRLDWDDRQYIDAVTMARMLVVENLKAPRTAKHAEIDEYVVYDLRDGRYKVTSYVDSENSFGAMIRTYYTIVIRYFNDEKGTFRQESIEFSP